MITSRIKIVSTQVKLCIELIDPIEYKYAFWVWCYIILQEPSRGRMKLSTELLVFGLFAVTICIAFPASKNVADNSKVLDLVNSREPHLTLWENVPIEEVEDDGYPYPKPSYPEATTTEDDGYYPKK